MSVFKVRKSPYYQYDFRRGGRRYSGSTKCLKLADAEAVEKAQIESAARDNDALKLAATLPRHVVREPFGSGWRYYFIIPAKSRRAGCPLRNEGLGTAFEEAVARAEDVLLPAYDAWCSKRRASTDIAVKPATEQPEASAVGVYLLLLKGKIVYVGSSKQMPKRVISHRSGSRPFDQVFYITTHESERLKLEAILIKAINPSQNTKGKVPPMPVPDHVPDPIAALGSSY